MSIEKNDVDISKVFNWGKTFEIRDSEGKHELTFYMRLVGDADLNRARIYALRKSAEMRRKLKDKDADEYNAFIVDKDELEKERLIALVNSLTVRELTRQAFREVKVHFPKEPKSDAPLESFEKWQKEVDEFDNKRAEKIREYVEKELKKQIKKLEKFSDDDLYQLYLNEITNQICEETMMQSFREMCVFLGSYKDGAFKERLWLDFNEFDNLESELKKQLLGAYMEMELSTEELKKLQEATQ